MKVLRNILCAAAVAVCVTVASLDGAQLQPNDKVRLKCSDTNDEILLEVKYAQVSVTLKNIVDDMSRNDLENPFPVMPIKRKMLEKYIIPALIAIQNGENGTKKTCAMLALKKTLDIMPLEELIELIINANYLDIDPLLTMTIDTFGRRINKIEKKELAEMLKTLEEKRLKLPKPIQQLVINQISAYDYDQDKTLKGHTHWVESLCISPNGTTLFSGSWDNTIKMWDIEKGTCIKTLTGHTDNVLSVCISPDGKKLFSGSSDRTIKIWDIEKGQLIKMLNGDAGWVRSVCISPDGKTLFSGSGDKTIKMWDIEKGTCIKTLTGHTRLVMSLSISQDGKTLFSGSGDKTIKMWDIEKGTCIKTLNGHTDSVRSLCISPDGTTLFSASDDKTIRMWDIEKGTCIKTLNGHTAWVTSVCISPDGTKLFSGSWDNTIKMWDIEQGTCIKTLTGHTDLISSVCISSDGTTLVSGSNDKTIKIWKRPSLNKIYKSEETNLIMQALLVTELTKHQENLYSIKKNSYEEKIWNEFPKETRVYLKKKLSSDTQQRLDNKHTFTIQHEALEEDENENRKLNDDDNEENENKEHDSINKKQKTEEEEKEEEEENK